MKVVEVYVTGKAWMDGPPYLSYQATCRHNPTRLIANVNEQVYWDCGCPYVPGGNPPAGVQVNIDVAINASTQAASHAIASARHLLHRRP